VQPERLVAAAGQHARPVAASATAREVA
jgi:hypothetical protein